MTPDEIAIVEKDQALGHRVAPVVQQYFANHQSIYGGDYLDNAKHRFVVLTTQVPSEIPLDLVAALGEDASAVSFEAVGSTESDLKGAQRRIDALASDASDDGFAILGTGIDVRSNRVLVRVTRLATEAEAALLEGAAGDGIQLAQTAEPPVSTAGYNGVLAPPDRAGLVISNGASNCDMGFIAYNSTPAYYALTAGHCWANGTGIYQEYSLSPTGPLVGTVTHRCYSTGCAADVEDMNIPVASASRYIVQTAVVGISHPRGG
jgi:hypothetical protein